MKDVTDIFVLNTETNLLTINKPEITTIKEFKDIIVRDKGGYIKGDSDGRKKLMSTKELMYIHLYCNPKGIYRDLPDEERAEKSKEHTELPDIWKVDPLVQAGIKKYKELLNMSALYHSYINANKAVFAFGEDLKFFNELRDKMRSNIKEKSLQLEDAQLEETKQELAAEIDHTTTRLMDLGIKINNISNNLPIGFETVEKLRKKLIDESKDGGEIYGGGEIGRREK